jgi:hypothetical protein
MQKEEENETKLPIYQKVTLKIFDSLNLSVFRVPGKISVLIVLGFFEGQRLNPGP